ncbi:MAG: hypothetical protein AB3N23_07165 [Paracoccaceae bacterium]
MPRLFWFLPAATLSLAACDPITGTDIRVGGSGSVGISTSASYGYTSGFGGGPPPGRTEAERQARKAYYRGPRGGDGPL